LQIFKKMMKDNLGIGFLLSGGLGYQTLKTIFSIVRPVFIFTDSNSTDIKDFSYKNDIPLFVGNPRNGRAYDFLEGKEIDVLFSVNYLFLVEEDILNKAKLYSINFHGSLLPKYRGRTPHVWAIINGENKVGVTAHLMTKECDAGDIVSQKEIVLDPEDTGADVLKQYENIYYSIIVDILNKIENNKLVLVRQDKTKATYFGKRTPADGLINWNWQILRIQNWVRAQSNPYPGAFCFYQGKKIIIDKVNIVDKGYSSDQNNGLILQVEPCVLVKVPNGVIEIEDVRNMEGVNFVVGEKIG